MIVMESVTISLVQQAEPLPRSRCRLAVLVKGRAHGFTLVEVLVAVGMFVLAAVALGGAMLQLNRQAALARVMNAAKAEALSRIQRISSVPYDPSANPPIIPSILNIGTTTEPVQLGDPNSDLGVISGTATWTVASVPGSATTRSVRCRIDYNYLGRNLHYELFTYKAQD